MSTATKQPAQASQAQAPSAPSKKKETKEERFRRLANARVPKAIKAIATVGNLANKVMYAYTAEQTAKIVRALTEAITSVTNAFAGAGAGPKTFEI